MAVTRSRTGWSFTDLALATFFVVVTFGPPLATLARVKVAPLTEKRAPVARPPFAPTLEDAQTFPRKFDDYWNDAFGFRPTLVRAYNALAWRLGVSPSDKVVIGRAGWLFAGEDYSAVESYRATRPFTRDQLRWWRRTLEARQAWLRQRGSAYVFVVAPDKSTIYPEYMPEELNRVGATTRLDQLVTYLDRHSDVRVVDVRGALREAKARDFVYEPYDSHWNDLGTWVVYEQIIERIAAELPGVHPQPRDRFDAVRVHGLGNDLALVLSLGHLLPGERLNFVPRVPRRARWVPYEGPLPFGTTAGTISEIDDPALPRAVVFHDSFGESLRPFLAEHFARAVYTWQALFDPALVERERPAVVVQEIVERSLMQEHPTDPEEVRRATATRAQRREEPKGRRRRAALREDASPAG